MQQTHPPATAAKHRLSERKGGEAGRGGGEEGRRGGGGGDYLFLENCCMFMIMFSV